VHLGGSAPRFPHTPADYSGKIDRPSLEDRKKAPPLNPAVRKSSTPSRSSGSRSPTKPVRHRLGTPPPRPSVKSRLGSQRREESQSPPRSSVKQRLGSKRREESRHSPTRYRRSPSPRRPGTSARRSPSLSRPRAHSRAGRVEDDRKRTRSRYHLYVEEKKRRRN
jgi:hypothetical protein